LGVGGFWGRGGSALLRFGATAEAAVSTCSGVAACDFCGGFWLLAVLVDELGVLLVAFGGEADVVELDFVGA
jgi:hypothetical protein